MAKAGDANPAPYSFNSGKQDGFNLYAIDLSLEQTPTEEKWSTGYKVELFLGSDARSSMALPSLHGD